jgi:hypothetical protein
MKLSEYINQLQEFVKENPETSEFEVCYSIDDEGNGYNDVYYTPTIGYRDKDGEFISLSDTEWFEENEDAVPNSVCIN